MTTTLHNNEVVPDLHVGHGIPYGALTLFPVWTPGTGNTERRYTLTDYQAGERTGGPSVPSLTLTSTGTLPSLVLEGTVLEGGWQHRVLLHSVLMAPGQKLDVDVACVSTLNQTAFFVLQRSGYREFYRSDHYQCLSRS